MDPSQLPLAAMLNISASAQRDFTMIHPAQQQMTVKNVPLEHSRTQMLTWYPVQIAPRDTLPWPLHRTRLETAAFVCLGIGLKQHAQILDTTTIRVKNGLIDMVTRAQNLKMVVILAGKIICQLSVQIVPFYLLI